MTTKCTALTKNGRPCQSHAKTNTTPPRCNIHLAAETGLPNGRRCTATNKSGTRCRQWTVRHSDPPRCIRHTDQPPPPVKHNRRCTALNKDQTQCRRSAMLHTEPPICPIHNGRTHAAPLADHQRCTATNRHGSRCRNRARLDSLDVYGRALCAAHLPDRTFLPPADSRCTAVNPDGTQCRQWILTNRPDDQPTEANLCVFHAGLTPMDPFPAGQAHPNWVNGFHSKRTPLEETCKIIFPLSRKITKAAPSFNDPIPILQELLIMCRCLVAMLLYETKNHATMPLWKFCRYTSRIFTGTMVIEKIVIEIHKQKQIEERRRAFMEPIFAFIAEMDAAGSDHDTP